MKNERKKGYAFKQPVKRRQSRFFVRILPEVKRGVEIVTKTRRARPLLTVSETAIFADSFFLMEKIVFEFLIYWRYRIQIITG